MYLTVVIGAGLVLRYIALLRRHPSARKPGLLKRGPGFADIAFSQYSRLQKTRHIKKTNSLEGSHRQDVVARWIAKQLGIIRDIGLFD